MKGKFSFYTDHSVTDEEGRELETLLLHWALTHKNKISFYWYTTIDDVMLERVTK